VAYEVEVNGNGGSCTCEAGRRGRFCRHKQAAYSHFNQEQRRREAELAREAEQLPMEGLAVREAKDRERLTKLGYRLDEVTSALQKEIRRGDEEAAVYWALLLYDAAPYYAWKRVLITAAEDIGPAAPDVVAQVCALAQAWRMCRESAWYVSPHHLTMAVVLLCRAPKSTEVEDLQTLTLELIKRGHRRPVLPEYLDAHTRAGRERGATWREWYENRHRVLGVPVNKYTRRLWEVFPEWEPTGLP
jgi:replication-associated recombination protein RarA